MELLDAPSERVFDVLSEIDGVVIVHWPRMRHARPSWRAPHSPTVPRRARSRSARHDRRVVRMGAAPCARTRTCRRGSSSCGAGPASIGPILGDHGVAVARHAVGRALADRSTADRGVRRPSGSRALAGPARKDRLARRQPERPLGRRAHQGAPRRIAPVGHAHPHRAGPGLHRRDPARPVGAEPHWTPAGNGRGGPAQRPVPLSIRPPARSSPRARRSPVSPVRIRSRARQLRDPDLAVTDLAGAGRVGDDVGDLVGVRRVARRPGPSSWARSRPCTPSRGTPPCVHVGVRSPAPRTSSSR